MESLIIVAVCVVLLSLAVANDIASPVIDREQDEEVPDGDGFGYYNERR